jgi:hypothetical protein
MIIWSGFGFLVGVFGLLALVLTEYVSELLAGNESYYQENSWLRFVGMAFAALLTFILYQTIALVHRRGDTTSDHSDHSYILAREHSFFFISIRWWPVIFLVLGVFFVFL